MFSLIEMCITIMMRAMMSMNNNKGGGLFYGCPENILSAYSYRIIVDTYILMVKYCLGYNIVKQRVFGIEC